MRSVHLQEVEDLRLNFRAIIDRLVDEGKWQPIEDRTYTFRHTDAVSGHVSESNYFMFIYKKIK